VVEGEGDKAFWTKIGAAWQREELMRFIEEGRVDSTLIVTHRTSNLADGRISTRPFARKKMVA
jgi:hypothetical protein